MNIDKALGYLSDKADEAEIYFVKENSEKIEVEGKDIRLTSAGYSSGYGIRVLKDFRLGFYYTTELSEEALNKSLEIAEVARRDENFCLPSEKNYPEVEGIYDKRIEELEIHEAKEYLSSMLHKAEDYKVRVTTAAISWEYYTTEIYNTHGVEARSTGTDIFAYLSTVAGDIDESSTGLYYDASRKLDLDFEDIGREASSLAKKSLNPEKIETGNYTIALKPMAVAELLENALIPSFNADNVQRQRSILSGKKGEKLFGNLSIIDDGTLEAGLLSSRMDDEGKATERKVLVDRGVLKDFLYDCYTAKKEGRESNGSASRGSYSSLPKVDASNFILSCKESSTIDAELVINGLIGAHTSNSITGDFSVEVSNAYLKDKPVKKAIISGNVFELIKSISAFGKDKKQFSNVVSPSIEFENIRVVG